MTWRVSRVYTIAAGRTYIHVTCVHIIIYDLRNGFLAYLIYNRFFDNETPINTLLLRAFDFFFSLSISLNGVIIYDRPEYFEGISNWLL